MGQAPIPDHPPLNAPPPGALPAYWDGLHWKSADQRWFWDGGTWQSVSVPLPVVLRATIYAAAAVVVYVPVALTLALVWGLQGPFWLYPFDLEGAAFQLGITLGCGLALSGAARLLLRVGRRDWWLGVVLAMPWIGTSLWAGVNYITDFDLSWLGASGLAFSMVVFASAGAGRVQRHSE